MWISKRKIIFVGLIVALLIILSSNYYGGAWASFNLDTLNNLISEKANENKTDQLNEGLKALLTNEEKIISLGNDVFSLKNVVQEWHIPE